LSLAATLTRGVGERRWWSKWTRPIVVKQIFDFETSRVINDVELISRVGEGFRCLQVSNRAIVSLILPIHSEQWFDTEFQLLFAILPS
jgi:hypothetical protein